VVINLAAQAGVRYSIENPKPYIDTNIVGYFNLLNASHLNDVKHFIYASSSSVYGLDNHFPYSENDQVDSPVSLYGATKKCNELIAHSYSYLYKMHTTGLRFFTVYGPFGRPDMAPIKFMKAIDEDRTLDVYNEGHLLRDFTYIDDIVEGVGKIIKSDVSNRKEIYKIYNIGNSSPVQLMDFIHTMEKIVGKEAKKNYLGMQDGDIYETYADVSQLEQDFGFHPSTTLYDGLSKLHDWFKSYKALL
jgi:Nucleoside-diphosphate-sugar epimerases